MNILHIDASSSEHQASHSRRLTAELVQRLSTDFDATVVHRDVAADRLPHVDTTIRQAWTPGNESDPNTAELHRRSSMLVDELKTADVIVIGSPMYNFSVPSTLKAWIDHVAIARQTFRYTENGPEGLLSGKRAYLVLSSGGIHSGEGQSDQEFLDSYLRAILGFMGVSDIYTVWAEGTALNPAASEAAMRQASTQIQNLVI